MSSCEESFGLNELNKYMTKQKRSREHLMKFCYEKCLLQYWSPIRVHLAIKFTIAYAFSIARFGWLTREQFNVWSISSQNEDSKIWCFFNGWIKFRDTFVSLAHDNPKLNTTKRFHDLSTVLTDEAVRAIVSMGVSQGANPHGN